MAVTSESWGDWSFDRRDDEIADVAWRGTVVLRSIRAVVRDRNWATGDLMIERIVDEKRMLVLHVRCTDLGADVHGTVSVALEGADFTVTVDVESRSAFLSNRLGLVVLQPHRLAGTPLDVQHTDGTREQTAFPKAVSPHQPVFGIRTLHWTHEGVDVTVDFSGDTFEMEDQRNWTDASFKTYSRPLDLPFPYEIAAGQRIVQQVRVTAAGAASTPPADVAEIVLAPGGAFPQILLGAASAADPAPAFDAVGDGVLVELDLDSTNWRAALRRAAAGGLPLDARLIVPAAADAQWGTTTPGGITGDRLVAALDDAVRALAPHPVLRIAAFDPISHVTEPGVTDALRAALAAHARVVPVLEGARSHFTELNREQDRIVTHADAVTFALTPLFHTLGDEQLFESVEVQRVLAAQALVIARGRPVHIGPVTLLPRFNNVATVREPGPASDDLDDGYGARFTSTTDPRQSSDALAAWTIASAAALALPGVASLTFFEQWGPRGVVSASGEPFPVASALRSLASLHGGELLHGTSPDGRVWALAGRTDTDTRAGTTILAANLDAEDRTVSIRFSEHHRAVRLTLPARGWVSRAL